MNKKLILNLVKSKSNPFKVMTDEQKYMIRLVKEVYGETTNKKKKKTATKNKKPCIVFDERRHKSPTIKKPFIGDDSIMKRRVQDNPKEVLK